MKHLLLLLLLMRNSFSFPILDLQLRPIPRFPIVPHLQ